MARNQLPADPLDRIRELEESVESLQHDLRAMQRERLASIVSPKGPMLAVTAEAYNADAGTWWYPGWSGGAYAKNAGVLERLPIIYVDVYDWHNNGGWHYWLRTEIPRTLAISPPGIGWIPPWRIVEVSPDVNNPRIVRGPNTYYGKLTSISSSEADWSGYYAYSDDACRQLVMGSANVRVYKTLSAGRALGNNNRNYFDTGILGSLVPQKYCNGLTESSHYVTATVNTITPAFESTNKLIAFSPDGNGHFVAHLEPCDLECEDV